MRNSKDLGFRIEDLGFLFLNLRSYVLPLAFILLLISYFLLPPHVNAAIHLGQSNTASLSQGLVLYWPLDGSTNNWTSNTTVDLSGNGNNGALGTLSTTTAQGVGKIGGAIHFLGVTNGAINAASAPTVGANFTYSMWVKPDSYTNGLGSDALGSYFLDRVVAGTPLVDLKASTDQYCLQKRLDDGTQLGCVSTVSGISVGKWSHIILMRNNGVDSIYKNGVLEASASDGGTITPGIPRLANHQNGSQPAFATIDDFRIYNRALSQGEVKQLYNLGTANTGLGQPRLIQHTTAYPNAPLAFSKNVTKSDLLVVGVQDANGGGNKVGNPTVTDTIGNTWTLATTSWDFFTNKWIYYAISTSSAADTVTVTGGTNSVDPGIHISEWAGLGDNPLTAIAGGKPNSTGGNVQIIQRKPRCILYSLAGDEDSTPSAESPGSGFTVLDSQPTHESFSEYMIKTTTGPFFANTTGGQGNGTILLTAFCANGTTAGYSNPIISNGLVGYWPLDGNTTNWTTNTTADISGNGNTATFIGMSTSTSPVAGKIGQALKFIGSSSNYINVGNIGIADFGTNDFSLSQWVKTTGASTVYTLSKRGACSHGNFWNTILGADGKHSFEIDDGNVNYVDLTSNGVVNDGKWHHLVDTRSGVVTKIYIDGALDIANTSAGTTNIAANSAPVYFGENVLGGACDKPFSGALDDVRIYNRALTAGEVLQLYGAGR